MRRRTFSIVLVVVAVAAAITVAVLLRKEAAPEPARLLPEADAFVYIDLAPLRKAGVFRFMAPVTPDAEYKDFLDQTGFQFERDLDEAAFAVHQAAGGQSLAATPGPEARFSEVFSGRFDYERVTNYLHKIAGSVDQYHEREIFNIPQAGRTVRVAILGAGLVAVSNHPDPQVIRGMIDRYHRVALPFGGPSLLRKYYRKVPLTSLAWMVARVSEAGENKQPFLLPGGYDLSFPPGAVILASVQYWGSVQIRAEALTDNDQKAQQIYDQVNGFLALFRTLQANSTLSGTDKDVQIFFNSLRLDREKNHVMLGAIMPPGFLKKLVSGPPTTLPQPAPVQEPPAAPKAKQRARSKSHK